MVGEMRDAESFSAAITAAEMGHLVSTTVHSNNAAQTITRVLDFFPQDERQQILSALAGCLCAVICQRMIPGATGGAVPCVEMLISTPIVRKLRGSQTGQTPLRHRIGGGRWNAILNQSIFQADQGRAYHGGGWHCQKASNPISSR